MRRITFIVCLLAAIVASAQYSGAGFYRVHSACTDRYISIKGTKFAKSTNADAFWTCIKMLDDSAQMYDPGSIIYIPSMQQTSLCAQGVSTYTLTGLLMEVDTANVMEGGLPTYIATTEYYDERISNEFHCIFREFGVGLTAGVFERFESHWWIEPVNEESIETSYLGVKPVNEAMPDADGYYWATICCDFPFLLPAGGGVEGAYTIQEVKMGSDSLYYAAPVLVSGQGEVVPAATPVLLKCTMGHPSGNKIVPVGQIANHTTMPIVNDMLMGNYFSNFINHASLYDPSVLSEYVPDQATVASETNLALGVDDEGRLGFYPMPEGSYMAANTAWLTTAALDLEGVTAVYLGEAPVNEDPEPEPVIKGDVDGNGELNVGDATRLIAYLMSYNPEEAQLENEGSTSDDVNINYEAADFNSDGQVNITDAALLISVLLNLDVEPQQ